MTPTVLLASKTSKKIKEIPLNDYDYCYTFKNGLLKREFVVCLYSTCKVQGGKSLRDEWTKNQPLDLKHGKNKTKKQTYVCVYIIYYANHVNYPTVNRLVSWIWLNSLSLLFSVPHSIENTHTQKQLNKLVY